MSRPAASSMIRSHPGMPAVAGALVRGDGACGDGAACVAGGAGFAGGEPGVTGSCWAAGRSEREHGARTDQVRVSADDRWFPA